MTIPTNDGPPTRTPRERRRLLRLWTRRLHFYLGLHLLVFVWFFALTGLLLNHPEWEITRFWSRRQETTVERTFARLSVTGDDAMARALVHELNITGEITQTSRAADDRLTVQVVRPGRVYRIEADLERGLASVVQIRLDAAGAFDALHKFTGVRMDDANLRRDWLLTTIWSLAMDAVALGLVILILSGLYLWYRLEAKLLPGLLSLALGAGVCALFLVGLAHIL